MFGSLFLFFTGNRESGINKMITFQSKYYDSESGFYYYYHRYYDPNTGRFITEDPIGISGGLNLYRFVNNNPVMNIDPLGLFTDAPLPGGTSYKYNNQHSGMNGLTWSGNQSEGYQSFLANVIQYTAEGFWDDVVSGRASHCICEYMNCVLNPSDSGVYLGFVSNMLATWEYAFNWQYTWWVNQPIYFLDKTTPLMNETVVVTGTLPSSLTSKASTLGALITLGLEGYCWWKLRNCVKK